MRAEPLSAPAQHGAPPVVWSIAGIDTAGGAGLSADQRAADALGVHLCPVVAALTAQHSQGVDALRCLDADWLNAQMLALSHDLPPVVVKTGLLGSVAAVRAVAQWVDRLRRGRAPGAVALVVDPVLGASAGERAAAAFSHTELVQAVREHLLPRATLITPNRREAALLLGWPWGQGPDGPEPGASEVPAMARALQALGAGSVVITGGDAPQHEGGRRFCADWLLTPQARGWLTAPWIDTPHHHGTGCTFATSAASALALGHREADAVVLASLATRHALAHGHAAGQGAGPVRATPGLARGPALGGASLPWLGLGEQWPWRLRHTDPALEPGNAVLFQPWTPPADGLYGIVSQGQEAQAALHQGLRCVQLRHKALQGVWPHLMASLNPTAHTGSPCTVFINDHWRELLAAVGARAIGPGVQAGLHLGQEDLLGLSELDQARLLSQRHRLALGLSSHSLWELARALGCGPSLVACGPVLATQTKDMPWRPQGLDNLAWWVANSPVPVVAIGGLLQASDVRHFAASQCAALCVVRGLGAVTDPGPDGMAQRLPALRRALDAGRQRPAPPPWLPHPVL